MDVDYSVELGAEDDALEFPWASPEGELRYWDLKASPDLLLQIEEATRYRELGEFLAAINSAGSMLLTAKCDAWFGDELQEAEEIYGASEKFCSYIDLLLEDSRGEQRFDFEEHENVARRLTELLKKAPEISAAVEFIVRRCYYHSKAEAVRPGYYLTFYLSGYGDDDAEARQSWGIGLRLVQNAIMQLSAEVRRAAE